jgi:molybdenum cofactor cytidylyltransferase
VPDEIITGKEKTAVIILAAGLSSRMQTPKPLLPFDSNRIFIEKIVAEYLSFGCGEIVVVVNEVAEKGIHTLGKYPEHVVFIVNHHPELGRFLSLKLGLNQLGPTAFCFIQNVDNPFVNRHLLDYLYLKRGENHFVKPVYQQKGGHPVLLSKSDILFLKEKLDAETNLRALLAERTCLEVEVADSDVLVNINTNEEYQQIIKNRSRQE